MTCISPLITEASLPHSPQDILNRRIRKKVGSLPLGQPKLLKTVELKTVEQISARTSSTCDGVNPRIAWQIVQI
ncbi:hypothetical protein [Leptothermofonsia sichuanensis]|uniref:hypothetical protein n=1 Tax=Leptothermofonsia sichuanensis TaxID=2917832 RepID=UPI001CA77301